MSACCTTLTPVPCIVVQGSEGLHAFWDHHIAMTAQSFRTQQYSLFTNNCHVLVASFLDSIGYRGHSWWVLLVSPPASKDTSKLSLWG